MSHTHLIVHDLGVAQSTMAFPNKTAPPLPPRTQDMLEAMRPYTLPRTNYSDQPPPLPPRPGSSTMRSRVSAGDIIPRLPPKPLPRSVSTPDTQLSVGRSNYDTIPVPISELTKGFTANIPSSIVVRDLPPSDAASNLSLANGDILNLHFSKSTRVVNVLSISGMKVMVPINSPMLCSVLYDPVDDIERAENGYIFGSGCQLFNAFPLPQFIGVSKGCKQMKNSSMFTAGEILVVKDTCNNGKFLKCLTIPDGEPRLVHISTPAVFTTNPNKIKMHLSEVVKHLEYQLKLRFFPQDVQLLQHMRKPYTLLNVESQKSVIATYGSPKQFPTVPDKDKYIMEIFSDFPLKCDLIEFTKPEKRDLVRKSKKLFETFNPSCVNEIISNVPSAVSSCQARLFSTVGQVHGTLSRNETLIHTASITGPRSKHVPIPPVPIRQPHDFRYTTPVPGPVLGPGPVPVPRGPAPVPGGPVPVPGGPVPGGPVPGFQTQNGSFTDNFVMDTFPTIEVNG